MIRIAQISDHQALTEIAFLAKQTWNYPEEYLMIWKEELTVRPEYIKNNTVFVCEKEAQIVGFISLVENEKKRFIENILIEKGYWMDHIFIHPDFQHRGIGKQLVGFLFKFCKEKQISKLLIFVDPHSVGFYEKLGAQFVRMSDSSIPGRELPVFELIV